LQYPNNNNELSFSYGKIKFFDNDNIRYNASTTYGSSGSPIILRCNDNFIIGIHHSGISYSIGDNIGTIINSILIDIQQNNCDEIINNKINIVSARSNNFLIKESRKRPYSEFKNEIICVYNKNDEKPIGLLNDFKSNASFNWNEEYKKVYEEAKSNINENNIEIYINNEKIKFNYKYESNKIGKITIIFKFNKLLISTSHMFESCSSLESIDLSSFNANNAINMRYMFYGCSSLKSIDLSSFNTNNVTDMCFMFYGCTSLKSIDLSSFNINNVINISCMFYGCSSLKSIDLSSFHTNINTDISWMFEGCSSLKKQNVKLNKNEKKILDEIRYKLFNN